MRRHGRVSKLTCLLLPRATRSRSQLRSAYYAIHLRSVSATAPYENLMLTQIPDACECSAECNLSLPIVKPDDINLHNSLHLDRSRCTRFHRLCHD
jgi:hypothetical protein